MTPSPADERTPGPLTGFGLVCLGSAATIPGGFGIAFRASGIGYLPQSTILFVAGLACLSIGLHLARSARRAMFEPTRVPASARIVRPSQPEQPSPWAAPAERVRVQAWTVVDRTLPSAPRTLALPRVVSRS